MSVAIAAIVVLLWAPTPAAAQFTISPSPFLTALDNSGNIINGACIWTYLAGTTTAATTYTTSGGTANTNPIRSDSAGRFTAFLEPGVSYKFVFESSCTPPAHGTTLRTADNITAVPPSSANLDLNSITAGENIALGAAIYLSDGSGGNAAGSWYNADADFTYASSSASIVGIATAAITSGATGNVRIQGRVTGLTSLSAGELYYVSATAGGLVAAPPTNQWFVGKADSTTSLILSNNQGGIRLPDSDGTHSLVVTTTSNLTADRLLSLIPGDAARTLTISGNATVNQDTTTTTTAVSFNQFRTPQGRCTLTTATPVTTGDVTAATTLFYALYKGNQITLYDGSTRWVQMPFTQLSIAIPATTSTMYDVFVDYTAGTPALELVAWTNDTTRATALTTQDGVLVQTADTDSLYVCSIRTTGVSGQTEDSFAKRYVWNYYNRILRAMRVVETTDTWPYSTATLRQARATATNQLDFVVGVAEVSVQAAVAATASSDAATQVNVSIGLDSTSATATGVINSLDGSSASAERANPRAAIFTFPAIGRHTLVWLEWASGGTVTWFGDNGVIDQMNSGISGWIEG